MGQFIPIALSLAAAGVQKAETDRVIRKQNEADNLTLVQRNAKQKRADERVDKQIQETASSTSQDERVKRLGEYMTTLQRGKRVASAGLGSGIGSETFQRDSAQAAADIATAGGNRAALLSRIDAPILQRQNEGFGYGRTATDLGLIAREAEGDDFVNRLRMKEASRRRASMDFLAGALSGAGKGFSGAASGAVDTSIGPVVREVVPY